MRNGLKRAAAFALTILMLLTLLPAALATESVTTSDAVVPGLSLADDVSPLAITGENTVTVGEEITLTSDRGYYTYRHEWESSDEDVAEVVRYSGREAIIHGVSAGTVTITHRYRDGRDWRTEEYTVTVVEQGEEPDQDAAIYYLKTPDSSPDLNASGNWSISHIGIGKVNTTGADWELSPDKGEVENIKSNVGSYIESMDMGMEKQPDGSYKLDRAIYADDYEDIFLAYKDRLEEEVGGVQLDSVNDIEAIYLIPYKISRNNGTDSSHPCDYHIDCTINIVLRDNLAYTARFYVVEPGGKTTMVDAQIYEWDDVVKETKEAPTDESGTYPETKVVDGITYVLDYWYHENEREQNVTWNYDPTDEELQGDNAVNFYAYYVPKEVPVTVTKTVAGEETDESFAFEYTITNPDGTTVSDKFELNHGGEAEISVPNGAKFEVTETSADGYTTSYVINNEDEPVSGNKATIGSVPVEGATIAFTNTRNTVDVTIEKQVTGNMGDRSKDFEFVLSGAEYDGGPSLKFSGSQSGGFTVAPNGDAKIEFTLKHDQSVTLTGLPINAVLNIEEENAGGYDMSVSSPSGEDDIFNVDITADGETEEILPEVTITVYASGKIIVENNKEATPDTGIVTDSLPYIVILACVVAIGAVVIVRRRGRRDE